MLLANMAVSHKIYKSFPDQAVLRRHPPPQTKMMDDLVSLNNDIRYVNRGRLCITFEKKLALFSFSNFK